MIIDAVTKKKKNNIYSVFHLTALVYSVRMIMSIITSAELTPIPCTGAVLILST